MNENNSLDGTWPWGTDRVDLERAAIVTNWDEPGTAKRLFEFPDGSWMRMFHADVVRALRDLVNRGEPLGAFGVRAWLAEHKPELLDHWKELWTYQDMNLFALSGFGLHAVKSLRLEYDWESAARTLQQLHKGLRKGRFLDWFQSANSLISSLTPTNDGEVVKKMSDLTRERLDAHKSGEIEKQRIPTGIPWLDRALKGLFPDRMYVIVAGPGTGKTTLLYQILKNMAKANFPSHIFQADMPGEEMGERNAIMDVGRSVEEFSDEDFDLAYRLADEVDLITVDDRTLDCDSWEARAATAKANRSDLAVIATDFAGQVQAGGWSAADNGERVAKTGRRMAKSNAVAKIILQQPTQAYEETAWPRKNFVRGGKYFEIVAHVLLWIHYPHAFNPQMPKNYLQLHFLKNRDGDLVIIPILWDKANFTMKPWPGGKILNPEPGLYCDPYEGREAPSSGASRLAPVEMEDIPL